MGAIFICTQDAKTDPTSNPADTTMPIESSNNDGDNNENNTIRRKSTTDPSIAATKIQGVLRQQMAKQEAKSLAKEKYTQRFDPNGKQYYYINKRTGSFHVNQPKFTHRIENDAIAAIGIIRLQALSRRILARKSVLQRKKEVFSRHYDPDSQLTFYMDRRSGLTTWDKASVHERLYLVYL